MKYLLLLPLAVQALATVVDEFHFHFARGLPRWERIGHPPDTLTVLAPILWLVFSVRSERNLIVYIVAAAFSCFFVTRDEFVHADLCPAAEHLNHVVLFIAHPLVFAALPPLWPLHRAPAAGFSWLEHFRGQEYALPAQAALMARS
jgi:hypothetical protein